MFMLVGAAVVAAMMPGAPHAPSPAMPTPGTITIAPSSDAKLPVETARLFDDAVERAMLQAQFTPLPAPSHSRYVAKVEVTRTSRGVVTSDLPPAPSALAGLNGSVSLALPSAGDRLSDLVVTELKVIISQRGDEQVVWSGSAVTARVTGTRAGAVELVARTLADAVLARFPNQSSEPLSIP